jgi:hypothetical protein
MTPDTDTVPDIDYTSSILHLQDIKARLAWLSERHKYGQPEEDACDTIWDQWDELQVLQELEHDLAYCWDNDTAALIHEGHWLEYCEQTCYDLGDVQEKGIVAGYVNWEKLADAMQQDYKTVTLPDQNTFHVRS